jgi:hypothetical protein
MTILVKNYIFTDDDANDPTPKCALGVGRELVESETVHGS